MPDPTPTPTRITKEWTTTGNTLYVRSDPPPFLREHDWFDFPGDAMRAEALRDAHNEQIAALAAEVRELRAEKAEASAKAGLWVTLDQAHVQIVGALKQRAESAEAALAGASRQIAAHDKAWSMLCSTLGVATSQEILEAVAALRGKAAEAAREWKAGHVRKDRDSARAQVAARDGVIGRLREVLFQSKIGHRGDCPAWGNRRKVCDCAADGHNRAIDEAIAASLADATALAPAAEEQTKGDARG